MLRRVQKALDQLRGNGIGGTLRAAMRKIGVVETYLCYGINLRGEIPTVESPLPIEVRKATAEDFARFRTMPAPFPRHAQVRERFDLDQCYLGTVEGKIAHIVWLYYPHEQDRHPTRWLPLRPNEAEFAIAQTLPDFRGKQVYPFVFRQLLLKFRDEGYEYAYAYIEGDNIASRRGISKLGFRLIGRTWRIRLWHHYSRDPGSGYYLPGPCARHELG